MDEETIPTNPAAAMSPRGGGPPTSPYWGNEVIWNTVVSGHSNEMDQKARVWNTTSTRTPNETPAYCKEGSENPSAKAFPIAGGRGRQYTVYDPKTKKIEIVDTCFSTFHLNFAADANNTIWSGGGGLARLGEHQGAGRDARRGKGAGLDRAHRRHERQRQA